MSMPDNYDDYEDETPEPQPKPRDLRKQITDLNAELADLRPKAEKADVLEKENALYKANLGSLTEAQQEAVLKTAKEATADALRSQAELLGFVQPPEPPAPPEGIEAFDRVAQAAAGGEGGMNPANYDAEMSAAKSPGEARQIMAKYGRTPVVD